MVEESKRKHQLISCACGKCTLQIFKFDEHNGWKERRYAKGHANKGKPHSSEWNRKIGLPKIGKSRSKEVKIKVSKTLTGRSISEEHKRRIGIANKGDKSNLWKGGKYRDSRGYWKIWSPNHPFKDGDGYVFEHRLIMEKHLGRYLAREELVHHINEIKIDNRIENLQVMTRSEHSRYHFKNKKTGLFLKVLEIMGFEE